MSREHENTDIHITHFNRKAMRSMARWQKEQHKIERERKARHERNAALLNDNDYDVAQEKRYGEYRTEAARNWVVKLETDVEEHRAHRTGRK